MDYKQEFYSALADHLSKEEQEDIKMCCAEIESQVQNGSVDELYKRLVELFNNGKCHYIEFKLQLGNLYNILYYKNCILKRDHDWMCFIQDKFQSSYEKLLQPLRKDFKDLSKNTQQSIAWDIADAIKELMATHDAVNKLIAFYQDLLNLSELTSLLKNSTGKTDTVKSKIKQIEIKPRLRPRSPIIISSEMGLSILCNEFFKYISIGHFPPIQQTKKIEQTLKDFKVIKQHLPALIVRAIAEVFVNHGIINEISTNGNPYNLVNSNKKPLILPNRVASAIFNLTIVLGIEEHKGEDFMASSITTADPDHSKKDYVRTKLQTSANSKYKISLKSQLTEYQKFLLLAIQ